MGLYRKLQNVLSSSADIHISSSVPSGKVPSATYKQPAQGGSRAHMSYRNKQPHTPPATLVNKRCLSNPRRDDESWPDKSGRHRCSTNTAESIPNSRIIKNTSRIVYNKKNTMYLSLFVQNIIYLYHYM